MTAALRPACATTRSASRAGSLLLHAVPDAIELLNAGTFLSNQGRVPLVELRQQREMVACAVHEHRRRVDPAQPMGELGVVHVWLPAVPSGRLLRCGQIEVVVVGEVAQIRGVRGIAVEDLRNLLEGGHVEVRIVPLLPRAELDTRLVQPARDHAVQRV